MITEDYVSFETAKLLKEKGFDGNCFYVWTKTENTVPSLLATANFVEGEIVTNRETLDAVARYHMNIYGLNNRVEGYLCPSIAMAMKWLRKVYYLHITVHPGVSEYGFVWTYMIVFAKEAGEGDTHFYKINQIPTPIVKAKSSEQAIETAIKYCLENLI